MMNGVVMKSGDSSWDEEIDLINKDSIFEKIKITLMNQSFIYWKNDSLTFYDKYEPSGLFMKTENGTLLDPDGSPKDR
ncbi:9140_t:CDS:2 [Diversispora eburnea]|uniref:9140_t:CDS:1 n=1 Tax=Diversispora eburnea TaxID=1213867 RepID=A0A9N9G3L2_9GLOM|nr:9140_t:CDS:2 [Diversispora eburnea]